MTPLQRREANRGDLAASLRLDRLGPAVETDCVPAPRNLQREATPLFAQMVRQRELRGTREAGALAFWRSRVERVVGSGNDGRGIDLYPFAIGELRAQAVAASLDAANESRRVFDLHVGPLGADANGPSAVLRAMHSAVQRRDRARMLEQIAAVPEATFPVEAQSALLAKLSQQFGVHDPIVRTPSN